MAKYLVACACGQQLAVDTGQAGDQIVCTCGAPVAVPTLRQLRALPTAHEQTAVEAPQWGARQGAIAASLLATGLFLAIAAVSKFSEVPLPTIDPVAQSKLVDDRVKALTPLEAWDVWVKVYQPLANTGFAVYKHPASAMLQQNLDWHRWIQLAALGLAGACALGAAVLAFSKPSAAPGKPAAH